MSTDPATTCYHHGNLKNALLDAGVQLLVEQGVVALSLRNVARAVGVSHTAPYRHFSNKAALLRGLVVRGFAVLHQGLTAANIRQLHGPEQQIVEIGVVYVRFALANPDMWQLMAGGLINTDGEPEFAHASQEVNRLLLDIIEAGAALGVFRRRPASELAVLVWSAMHGLAGLLLAGGIAIDTDDRDQLDDLLRPVFQNMMYGIAR